MTKSLKPIMGPHDLHGIFNNDANHFAVYNFAGNPVFTCEMRNRTVGGDGFGHLARCPRGEFVLGESVPKHEVPFGYWFTPLLDYGANDEMADWGRGGIGIHGGGSGLPDPFAPEQGWVITEGCLRVANVSNARIVALNHDARAAGAKFYVTVTGS